MFSKKNPIFDLELKKKEQLEKCNTVRSIVLNLLEIPFVIKTAVVFTIDVIPCCFYLTNIRGKDTK